VLEEALTNVARHANAGRVEVTICKRRRRLFMEVRDDGRGITPAQFDAPGSVGIAAMRERAAGLGGRFRMLRDPVAGTRLRLWVPVSKNRGGAS
ncbi:MAG: ATP-binding protein, partial [Gammaproteobacteria bacterium]|nr:ATP-binding protein [Gammaproteobacteria bacterium]